MNYSFDVYDAQAHRAHYVAMYATRFGSPNLTTTRPLFSPGEFARRSRNGAGFSFATPSTPRRRPRSGRSGARGGGSAAASAAAANAAAASAAAPPRWVNVPLTSGDALVVRQVEIRATRCAQIPLRFVHGAPLKPRHCVRVRQIEIHRTDSHAVDPNQWRLAIGFKMLRKDRPIVREVVGSSPFGYDYAIVRGRWPAMLPPLVVGASLDELAVYDRARLAKPDALIERRFSAAYWLDKLATNALAVPFVGGVLLLLLSLGVTRTKRT